MFSNFYYKDKSIIFWEKTGVVLSDQKLSRTHVSSSGGGGYVTQYSGYVEPVRISSRTTTRQDIWLLMDNGEEHNIRLGNNDIPLREGQRITVVASALENTDSGWYTLLINHSAQRYWHIESAKALVDKYSLEPSNGLSLIIAILSTISSAVGLIASGLFEFVIIWVAQYLRGEDLNSPWIFGSLGVYVSDLSCYIISFIAIPIIFFAVKSKPILIQATERHPPVKPKKSNNAIYFSIPLISLLITPAVFNLMGKSLLDWSIHIGIGVIAFIMTFLIKTSRKSSVTEQLEEKLGRIVNQVFQRGREDH